MKITTNNQARELISFIDLTGKEQKEFDYIKDAITITDDSVQYETRFFRYKKNVYDANEFMRIHSIEDRASSELKYWDGVHNETYFSGVLIRYADNCAETVIVARYFS